MRRCEGSQRFFQRAPGRRAKQARVKAARHLTVLELTGDEKWNLCRALVCQEKTDSRGVALIGVDGVQLATEQIYQS